MADFANALTTFRKKEGISGRELSRRANISQAYLSQLETGKCSCPGPELIKSITQGFNDDYITLMVAAGYLPEGCYFSKGSEVIPKKRTDLIGQTGTRTTQIEVIDAKEYETGVSVQVSDNTGEVYWTDLENVDLD